MKRVHCSINNIKQMMHWASRVMVQWSSCKWKIKRKICVMGDGLLLFILEHDNIFSQIYCPNYSCSICTSAFVYLDEGFIDQCICYRKWDASLITEKLHGTLMFWCFLTCGSCIIILSSGERNILTARMVTLMFHSCISWIAKPSFSPHVYSGDIPLEL